MQAWKARIAIRSIDDAVLPKQKPPDVSTTVPIAPRSRYDSDEVVPLTDIASYLCYACHTTLTSRSSRGGAGATPPASQHMGTIADAATLLPMWARARLGAGEGTFVRKLGDDELAQRVGEFLLGED